MRPHCCCTARTPAMMLAAWAGSPICWWLATRARKSGGSLSAGSCDSTAIFVSGRSAKQCTQWRMLSLSQEVTRTTCCMAWAAGWR
jgi:hypothetical protein